MDIYFINEITKSVEREFGNLDEGQLNKKLNAKSWSIGQCIDHIIVSNETYFPALNILLTGKNTTTFWEKNNMLTNYTGRRMISTLGPVIVKKFKSPPQFIPSPSEIKTGIISQFREHNEKLYKLFLLLENKKFLEKVITSPVASLITLRVKDVMEIIIVHEQRHLQQALKIKNTFGFK